MNNNDYTNTHTYTYNCKYICGKRDYNNYCPIKLKKKKLEQGEKNNLRDCLIRDTLTQ